MARAQGRLTAHVLFLEPAGCADGWAETALWRKAAAIPGVIVQRDEAGTEAQRFHAETSGHTVLYDLDGRLMFHGGITIARGHSGDNPGRDAIVALLRKQTADRFATPVFGCPLIESECHDKTSK